MLEEPDPTTQINNEYNHCVYFIGDIFGIDS